MLGDYGAPVAAALWGEAGVVSVRDGVAEGGRYIHPPLILLTPNADADALRSRWVALHGDWGQEHAARLRVATVDGMSAEDVAALMEPIAHAASSNMELYAQTVMGYPLTQPRCFVIELRSDTEPDVVQHSREWHSRTLEGSGLRYEPLVVVVGHLALPSLTG